MSGPSLVPTAVFLLIGVVLLKWWTTASRLTVDTLGGDLRRACSVVEIRNVENRNQKFVISNLELSGNLWRDPL